MKKPCIHRCRLLWFLLYKPPMSFLQMHVRERESMGGVTGKQQP